MIKDLLEKAEEQYFLFEKGKIDAEEELRIQKQQLIRKERQEESHCFELAFKARLGIQVEVKEPFLEVGEVVFIWLNEELTAWRRNLNKDLECSYDIKHLVGLGRFLAGKDTSKSFSRIRIPYFSERAHLPEDDGRKYPLDKE